MFLRVDAPTLDDLDNATGLASTIHPIWRSTSYSRAVNFNEAETNFRTYYGSKFSGSPKYMVAFDFDTVRRTDAPSGTCSALKAGWRPRAMGPVGSSNLGGCAVDDVWCDSLVGYRSCTALFDSGEGRHSWRIHSPTATAWTPKWRRRPCRNGAARPRWVPLLELDDAVGDETGDGDYVYPLATDFNTPNGGGLWDTPHGAPECLERSIHFDHEQSRYLGACQRVQPPNRPNLCRPR